MHIHKLTVEDFRNLLRQELAFANGPVIIWGENGQGKSNLLEAIYLSCTGTLWRAGRDDEAIQWGSEIGRVKAEVRKAHGEGVRTEIALVKNAHPMMKINGVVRKRGDFYGLAPVIAFSNEDMQIIKGDPARRRQFLNAEFSQLNRSYRWNLVHYNRSLEQRNRLLKEIRENNTTRETLQPWEQALAKYGTKLILYRAQFLHELEQAAAEHLGRLAPGWVPLRLLYRPALRVGEAQRVWEEVCPETPEALGDLLIESFARNREEEVARGYSLIGPHRDDFEPAVAGVDQRTFGSQGQQRSVAVALRLGLADQIEQALGEFPILLLDDILSELDMRRRHGLLESLSEKRQYFVTTPALEEVPPELLEKSQVCQMLKGHLRVS